MYKELREYQAGDDPRRIHWKASARTGRVYAKSYEEERMLRVMVALDTSPSTLFGADQKTLKISQATEFASLIGTVTEQAHDAFGLATFTDRVNEFTPPKREKFRLSKTLGRITNRAQHQRASETDLRPLLTTLQAQLRHPTLVFILSDFYCVAPFEQELRTLARKHDVCLVLLQDDLECALPDSGIVTFTNCEGASDSYYSIDTSDPAVRAAIKSMQQDHQKAIRICALACGARFARIDQSPLTTIEQLARGGSR
jgi:uncharacterized protein (DUF58 family)